VVAADAPPAAPGALAKSLWVQLQSAPATASAARNHAW
jgi:hypothetical protein